MTPAPEIVELDESRLKIVHRTWCSEIVIPASVTVWNRQTRHMPDRFCKRRAAFRINGTPYCEIHAGRLALRLLIENYGATKETPNA